MNSTFDIVAALRGLAEDLERNPAARIVELEVGSAASPEILARGRRSRNTPAELVELASRMDGFHLEWEPRNPGGSPPLWGGRVEVPTLERNLQGWTGYITLEQMSSRGIRLPDVIPCEEREVCPCYIQGGFLGTWSFYSDVFQDRGLDLETYFEAGIRNLFVRGWFRHVLENGFGSVSPAALRAREALGLQAAARGTP